MAITECIQLWDKIEELIYNGWLYGVLQDRRKKHDVREASLHLVKPLLRPELADRLASGKVNTIIDELVEESSPIKKQKSKEANEVITFT